MRQTQTFSRNSFTEFSQKIFRWILRSPPLSSFICAIWFAPLHFGPNPSQSLQSLP